MIGKTIKETQSNIDAMPLEERIAFLIENKEEIIAQKKASFKMADSFGLEISKIEKTANKSEPLTNDEIKDTDIINVEFIANLSMWFDSHRDVQGEKCWTQSLKDINLIYHTKNHSRDVDDILGDINSIKMEKVRLDKLGVKSAIKEGVALVVDSDIDKDLDIKMFKLYAKKKVKQHSVGMNYIKIELAVNNAESEKEYAVWTKYINKIINKEEVEKAGYFWYVSESKLIEVSAVTRGSNSITPTLNVSAKSEQSKEKPQGKLKEYYLSQIK